MSAEMNARRLLPMRTVELVLDNQTYQRVLTYMDWFNKTHMADPTAELYDLTNRREVEIAVGALLYKALDDHEHESGA